MNEVFECGNFVFLEGLIWLMNDCLIKACLIKNCLIEEMGDGDKNGCGEEKNGGGDVVGMWVW